VIKAEGRAEPVEVTEADRRALLEGVKQANIPTLIPVLVQLTGERKWLEPPYAPRKGRGLDDNDTGGLPGPIQDEIKSAAAAAIANWLDRAPVALARPDDAMLARMLSVSMSEDAPPEYGEIIASDMGMASHRLGKAPRAPAGFCVAIIGAGVSGICAAIKLRELGIACEIFEKAADFGGTWWENAYPGAGVDTPNHIYSFSFARNDWSRYFALQGELLDYFIDVADRHGLRQCTHFNTAVRRIVWDDASQKWNVELRGPGGDAEHVAASVVISAVGALNNPLIPAIPGLETFPGPAFHTAQWPEDLDIRGKRVAVVGNGASAMQVVPAIAEQVGHLTVFARSKQWAAPFPQFQKEVPGPVRALLRHVPLYHAWYRQRLAWTFNDRIHESLQKDSNWPHPERSLNAINDGHRSFFTDYVVDELGERRDLLEKVLPDYPPYGKRMLLDNGWYRAIARNNVTLIAERLAEVRGRTLVASGGETHEADILVLATGFRAVEFLASFDVIGRQGRVLREHWGKDNARAYLGATIPGFPNLFTLLGPNVGLGHGGSVIKAVELQVDYVLSVLARMFEHGAASVEVREDVCEGYNARVDEAHQKMVWTHQGTDNWYRNSRGRVVAITPWRNDDFWRMTRQANADDYFFAAPDAVREDRVAAPG
jgi:4-hydroxyacetophenone monooxygenase